ncbi:MAG: hypothetical protein V3V62_02770 [bacterium]
MKRPDKMERTNFNAARVKLEISFKRHLPTLHNFYTLFDKSMTRYGEENKIGLNLVGIYDKDLRNFTGLGHVGLLMPRARLKIRHCKEANAIDLEVGVLLDEYGRDDDRDDPFERMRMDVTFDPENKAPLFRIRRFESEVNAVTGRKMIRPVDQGLDLLLQSIAERLGTPKGNIIKKEIQRRISTGS